MDQQKLSLWVGLGAFAFVLGVAIWLRNPGLFILAGLCLAPLVTLWRRRS
jgi:uncharacterized membrane protein